VKYIGLIVLAFIAFYLPENYLSPGAMAIDDSRDIVYTALTTAKAIAVTDIKTAQTTEQIKLKQNPNELLISPDANTLFAACGEENGSVEIFSLPDRKRKTSIKVGHTPEGLALSSDGKILYVANRFSNNVSVINLSKKKEIATIPTVREPRAVCISPDGKTVAVANFLPTQAANGEVVAAQITLIDAVTNKVRSNTLLANGAQSVTGLAFSTDGKYLYAVHLLSRYNVPVTQLDRGWVNTNALSIIDITDDSVYATILLDDVDNGAANPFGICTGNDSLLYITIAGAHELIILNLNGLHDNISALFSGTKKDAYIHNKEDLSASLSFVSPYKQRIKLKGRSPRAVILSKGSALVSSRFSAFLEQISGKDAEHKLLTLGDEPAPNSVRRGELAFSDASICYQQWQSCLSCHPDGRADGLNWDQQNDGLGNPKNTKSLLYSHVTPPCMITGIRVSAELAVRNGILHTLQTRQPENIAADMDDYLKQLAPVTSPYLAEYRKKDAKQLGKKLFEQAGCAQCHTGEYFTDMKKYDVGTGDGDDKGRPFDTPSLRETWRTAPYLYDGRAVTLKDVFSVFNPDDKHGFTKNLTEKELDALILYVKTL